MMNNFALLRVLYCFLSSPFTITSYRLFVIIRLIAVMNPISSSFCWISLNLCCADSSMNCIIYSMFHQLPIKHRLLCRAQLQLHQPMFGLQITCFLILYMQRLHVRLMHLCQILAPQNELP